MSSKALDMSRAAVSATATAPAKINLTLDVLGRRGDGYHELRSVVIGVDLCDVVRCRALRKPGIELICNEPGLGGPENLAYRAALALGEHLGHEPAGRIELAKTVPVGAGLGGGSSDAATTLRLCNEVWDAGLDHHELAALGAELGSDVPLFFSLPSVVITGRGERTEPVKLRWSGWVLLAFVDERVSTAEVYGAWRPSDAACLPHGMNDVIIRAATADEMSGTLSNHLEPAVFRVSPKVARAYDELNRAGLGCMHVSGAGSTLYRLFDEREAACRAAQEMENLQIGIQTTVVAAPTGPNSVGSEES